MNTDSAKCQTLHDSVCKGWENPILTNNVHALSTRLAAKQLKATDRDSGGQTTLRSANDSLDG
jgi:hypothetical protein